MKAHAEQAHHSSAMSSAAAKAEMARAVIGVIGQRRWLRRRMTGRLRLRWRCRCRLCLRWIGLWLPQHLGRQCKPRQRLGQWLGLQGNGKLLVLLPGTGSRPSRGTGRGRGLPGLWRHCCGRCFL